jgi:hypothetical protein
MATGNQIEALRPGRCCHFQNLLRIPIPSPIKIIALTPYTFFVSVKLCLHISGLLLLGAGGHKEYKSGGHLEL